MRPVSHMILRSKVDTLKNMESVKRIPISTQLL